MKDQTEIIVLVVVLVLIYTRPSALVRFSSTFIGKLILLVAVVIASLVSPLSGLLIATLMVLYTEQNYEGFKEGFTVPVTDLKVNGDYVAGDTDIMLEYGIDDHDKIELYVNEINDGNYDIVKTTLFDAQTRIISATVEGLHIELVDSIPSTTISSVTDQTITIQVKNNDTFVDAATGRFQIDQSTTDNNYISGFVISTKTLNYIQNADAANSELQDIVGEGNLKLKLDENSDVTYDIKSSKLIVSVKLSSGIKQDVAVDTNGVSVTIEDHSHTHGHKDGFEGLENKSEEEEDEEKNEDEKEDDETKDAVKNIMDKLDIAGIIDTVKKESDKTEGFFSGERESGNEVAGAFAGESYESEITGVAECTTTICERIHREEQLIRPVNSNEELQRV